MDEYIEVEVFDSVLNICDDESWRGMLENIMRYLVKQNGIELDEDSEAWFDFKYEQLEPQLIGGLQVAVKHLEGMRCCDPEYWRYELAYLAAQEKED